MVLGRGVEGESAHPIRIGTFVPRVAGNSLALG